MTATAEADAGGSRVDGQPSSNGAPRPSGASRRTSPRRRLRDVAITDEERQLLAECVNPDPRTSLGEKNVNPVTRLKKYIAGSPRLPARLKGAAMVLAERVGRASCETTFFSYADIAAAIGSPRKQGQATIHRRTAIGLFADLEAYGVLEIETRWPTDQRDPHWPKNWRNRFRLRFPPHAPARVEPQGEDGVPAGSSDASESRDTGENSDADEQRRADRDAIEAEITGAAPPAKDLDDVAPVGEPDFFEKMTQRVQRAQAKRANAPKPPTSSPPRPGSSPPASTLRPPPAKDSAAAAPTELELAITGARLRSTKLAISEILALHAKAFSSLPRDFVETTSDMVLRESISLMTMLNGIEQSLRKPGRRGQTLAHFVVGCITHMTGKPTASVAGKKIVRRIEDELEETIAALRVAHRGRAPPPSRGA